MRGVKTRTVFLLSLLPAAVAAVVIFCPSARADLIESPFEPANTLVRGL